MRTSVIFNRDLGKVIYNSDHDMKHVRLDIARREEQGARSGSEIPIRLPRRLVFDGFRLFRLGEPPARILTGRDRFVD